MAGLDFLFQGQAPASLTANVAASQDLPGWYQEYLRGIAGKAVNLASEPYQPYQGQRLADFTDDQRQAFNLARNNQGAWQPTWQAAQSAAQGLVPGAQAGIGTANAFGTRGADLASQYGSNAAQLARDAQIAAAGYGQQGLASVLQNAPQASQWAREAQINAAGLGQRGIDLALQNAPQASQLARDAQTAAAGLGQQGLASAQQYGQQGAQYGQQVAAAANQAAAGPAASWTNNYSQYMSPYTQQVVNEIGRLGNRNLMENIVPGVTSAFVGSGQFGSTRNADILGRAIRDTQADISGQQSQALQQGYGQSANIFANDAARQQQQQQLQASTALQGGNLGLSGINQGGQLVNNAYNTFAGNTLQGGNLASNQALQGAQFLTNTYSNAANTALQGGNLASGQALQGAQLLGNTYGNLGSQALQGGNLGMSGAIQGGQLASGALGNAGSLALQGVGAGTTAGTAASQQLGNLAQSQQSLGYGDVNALGAVGGAQQALQQQAYDQAYQEFLNQRGYGWNQLGNVSSAVRGMPLSQSSTQVTNQPASSNFGASPLSWLSALGNLNQANNVGG